MNLLLVGPQASGKGTQAEKLIEKYKLAHVEMGGLLRNIAKEETEFGQKIGQLINSGQFVPDEMIIEIINQRLSALGRLDGILFDGFPRVISQAQYFEQYLTQKGQKLDLVIVLSLPRAEVFKRLANRRTCSSCGRVYNLLTRPPQKPGVCDNCQSELIIRADESEEKINKRLDEFENKTLPMIEYFKNKQRVEEFDGNRPIEEIFSEIVECLEKRGLTANV